MRPGNRLLREVPAWEKRFCLLVGRMTWRDFLEAKKHALEFEKIMNWDDLACKESFDNAKSRFWSANGGPPSNAPLPRADTYIDQVDWDAEVDPELFEELDAALERKGIEEVFVSLEHVKPTGWDEGPGLRAGKVFTGMIIGEGEDVEEYKLVERKAVQDVSNNGDYNGNDKKRAINYSREKGSSNQRRGGNYNMRKCSSRSGFVAGKPENQRDNDMEDSVS